MLGCDSPENGRLRCRRSPNSPFGSLWAWRAEPRVARHRSERKGFGLVRNLGLGLAGAIGAARQTAPLPTMISQNAATAKSPRGLSAIQRSGHHVTQRYRDRIEAIEKTQQAEQQAADDSSGEAQSHIPDQAKPLALPSDDEPREAPPTKPITLGCDRPENGRLRCRRSPNSPFGSTTKAYWFAGIVTTGAGPLTPVSAIENSSMMIPNVYFDLISLSAIQNHRLSYCAET